MKRFTMLMMLAVLTLFLSSCGGRSPISSLADPPAVRADSVPSAQPVAPVCDAEACHGTYVPGWGYCQFETHWGPHSWSMDVEIGVTQSGNVSQGCAVMLAGSGSLLSASGNIGYDGAQVYNPNNGFSSAVVMVRTCPQPADCGIPANQEHVVNAKIQGLGQPVVMPVSEQFPQPLPVSVFLIQFNDDLAKPTTIHIGLAGEHN